MPNIIAVHYETVCACGNTVELQPNPDDPYKLEMDCPKCKYHGTLTIAPESKAAFADSLLEVEGL